MTTRRLALLALALAVGLAVVASPFASGSPDGLERVAADHAFLDEGRLAGVQEEAPVPDYALPGIADPRLATGAAGLLGALTVLVLGSGVARLAARRREGRPSQAAGTPPR